MEKKQVVITGIGVVSPCGLGKEVFWQKLEDGKNCLKKPEKLKYTDLAGTVNDEAVFKYLGQKGLRNLDRSTLMLLVASGLAINDAKLVINESNTDRIGVSTGTTFSHIQPIVDFDKEVFKEGINFASPALFPSTVLNAASSQVSIRYNIQGFNTTISTGFTSSLEALKYAINSINTNGVDIVLSGGVESLSNPLLFGLKKLGYLAGADGKAVSCPFDKRRNGSVPAEAAAMCCVESYESAQKRKIKKYAKIRSVVNCFDSRSMTKVYPRGDSLEKAIRSAMDESGIKPEEVDYISSCANSTVDLDRVEAKVLNNIFGEKLEKIPVSSIKSMTGETFSASGALQVISCVGAMLHGRVSPTINFKVLDPACNINCVPNKAREQKVDIALIVSSGPGGYNSACLLEKS